MHDSLTGGLSALHIPRDGWVEINKLFQDPTIGITDDDPLVLKSVEDFENEMTGLSEAGVECSAAFDDLDYLGTTNKQHKKLQQCLVDLSEEVGLVIPAKQMVVSTIQIPVNPEMLIEGIFPSCMQKLPKTNAQSPIGANTHLPQLHFFCHCCSYQHLLSSPRPRHAIPHFCHPDTGHAFAHATANYHQEKHE
jgi:hypothetical protein